MSGLRRGSPLRDSLWVPPNIAGSLIGWPWHKIRAGFGFKFACLWWEVMGHDTRWVHLDKTSMKFCVFACRFRGISLGARNPVAWRTDGFHKVVDYPLRIVSVLGGLLSRCVIDRFRKGRPTGLCNLQGPWGRESAARRGRLLSTPSLHSPKVSAPFASFFWAEHDTKIA
jgi:hypothetical protein